MASIDLRKLSLNFGKKVIFDELSLNLQDGDKITLVADNGAGKSTLIRAIALKGAPYFEKMVTVKGSIGWLPQSFEEFEDRPVIDHLILASQNTDLALLLDLPKSDEWFGEFCEYGGAAILQTYAKLGLKNEYLYKSFFETSSGERVKIYLAGLLNSAAEILLLDEPTNHLDGYGCEMIEKFIRKHKGITVMVTHDRALINNTGSRIYELCPFAHKLIGFKNGYAGYLAQQEFIKAKAEEDLRKQQKELADLRKMKNRLGVDDRSPQALKAKAKIAALKENMTPPQSRQEPRMSLRENSVSPNVSLAVTRLAKQPLFQKVSFDLSPGDKMIITGKNGTGKTTLFEIIMGMQKADKGSVRMSYGARIAFLDQEHESIDLSKTPVELMADAGYQTVTSAVQHLRNFGLYYEHDFFSKLADLSIGCRRKAHLAYIMACGVDILLLDEPTNHLYFNAIEQMEQCLLDFPGIIVAISHDRYFINKIGNKLLKLDSEEYRIA